MYNDLIKTYQKITRIFRDLIIFTIIAIFTFVLATVFIFDAFEKLVELTRKYEIVEINELITLLAGLSFAFSIFSFLRWKELRHETIKRKQVEEELNNRNKDLEILNTITQAVHQSLDLKEVYRIALDQVIELDNVDLACIYLVYEAKNVAVMQDQRNFPEEFLQRAGVIPYPKGATWKVISTGKISNVKNAQTDPDVGPAGRDLGFRSMLGIPINLEGKTIGVIWLLSYKEYLFTTREEGLLVSIGNHVATAIAKAKLYGELSKKSRYETIISAVTRSVHQSIELQEVLENAVDAMSKNISGVEHVAIHLVEGEEAVIKAYRGHPDWFIERVRRIPYPKGFTWKTIIEGKPRYCPDVDQDTFIGPAGREVGTKSYLSMPIRNQSKTVGCINVHSFQKNAFDEGELKLLEIVAQQIEVAINNAQIAEALRQSKEALRENLAQLSKKNRYETIISTVTRSVHQSIELQEVLENAVEVMRKNIDGVENVSIYLVEGEEAVIRAYRGYPDWFIKRAGRIPYPKGLTWKTIIEGKPRYVADAEKDTVIGHAGREMGTKSYVSMPVRFGGKTVGVININSLRKNAFDEEELKLLEIVAQQIEVAINNAQIAEVLRQSEESYRTAKDELEIKVKDLEVLTGLIRAVHESTSLDEIYRVALDSVIELENIDMVMTYLVD